MKKYFYIDITKESKTQIAARACGICAQIEQSTKNLNKKENNKMINIANIKKLNSRKNMKKIFLGILFLLFLTACATHTQTNTNPIEEKVIQKGDTMQEVVTLTTSDNVPIKGTFYISNSKRGIILLHMLNRNRQDYNNLAEKLSKYFSVISIDFRGHGESSGNWKNFNENDFNNMQLDIVAADKFLQSKEITTEGIIGGSIGANHAAIYATKRNLSFLVMLSPGLDYQKISPSIAVKQFHGSLFIAAADDDPYAAESSKKLAFSSGSDDKILKIYPKGGHGTWLFGTTDLEQVLLDWVKKR